MNRLFSLLAAAILLTTLSACGGAKPPTAAAAQGSKAITTLQDLSTLYGKKNLTGFMNLIAPGYPGRKEFSAALESVFSRYDTVRCTVQYTRMYITIADKGKTKATFNWDSSWEAKGGSIQKNSGRVTFVFEPKEDTLLSIDGTNPFIPQTVETQGKP
jgi:hypothetical protein